MLKCGGGLSGDDWFRLCFSVYTVIFPNIPHFLLSELNFICYFTILLSVTWYHDVL